MRRLAAPLSAVLLAISAYACSAREARTPIPPPTVTPKPQAQTSTPNPSPTTSPSDPGQTGEQVSLSGWFSVIWNGGPRYFLVDENGHGTELLVDDSQLAELGGPQELQGKRVVVTGPVLTEPEGALRVASIELQEDGGGDRMLEPGG